MKEINETITEIRDHAKYNQMDALLIAARKLVGSLEREICCKCEERQVMFMNNTGLHCATCCRPVSLSPIHYKRDKDGILIAE